MATVKPRYYFNTIVIMFVDLKICKFENFMIIIINALPKLEIFIAVTSLR